MSESTAKANRRELRRAVGVEAFDALAGAQSNLEALRSAILNLSNRADATEREFFAIHEKFKLAEMRDMAQPNPRTFRERLRWLWSGK